MMNRNLTAMTIYYAYYYFTMNSSKVSLRCSEV